MIDFAPEDCTYVYEKDKSEHPAYFFRMSTRDMALFGELYCNMGTWSGEQIISKEWIRESTTIYSITKAATFHIVCLVVVAEQPQFVV